MFPTYLTCTYYGKGEKKIIKNKVKKEFIPSPNSRLQKYFNSYRNLTILTLYIMIYNIGPARPGALGTVWSSPRRMCTHNTRVNVINTNVCRARYKFSYFSSPTYLFSLFFHTTCGSGRLILCVVIGEA